MSITPPNRQWLVELQRAGTGATITVLVNQGTRAMAPVAAGEQLLAMGGTYDQVAGVERVVVTDYAQTTLDRLDEPCTCGHTDRWHGDHGAGACEHDADCHCDRFTPPQAVAARETAAGHDERPPGALTVARLAARRRARLNAYTMGVAEPPEFHYLPTLYRSPFLDRFETHLAGRPRQARDPVRGGLGWKA